MRNLLVTIRFCGTRYHGFQVQKNALSICEVFQDAVERILGRRYYVKGCSRTDTGVHANKYCLSMKIEQQIPCENFVLALNRCLPEDIAVTEAVPVSNAFHARYCCTGKEYVYRLHNSRIRDPFSANCTYRYGYPLDETAMDRQARCFEGTHDFAAFQSKGSDVTDTVRTISSFRVERHGEEIRFTVRGDGFLYNMVRIMVGTLLYIEMGRIERDSIPAILISKDRGWAGKTMPACGLYLNDVFYPPESLYLAPK